MAALPTTLPAPPTGLGADSTAQQEYFAALDRTLQALEARATRGPNLFKMAGAFLDPGRTGSFGEAVGRVATGVGEDLQRQAEMELPIAQVRAQLAGQKFQVANEAKALDLVSSVLGTSPAQTNAVISSGQLPSDMVSKITPGLVIAVNKLDPKLGASLKQVFDMDVKRRELVNDDIKNGLSVSDLIIKYGPGVTQYLPSGAPLPGGGRAGTSPVRPSVAPVSEVPTTTPETTTTQTAPTTQTTQPRPVAQPVSATIPDSGLPLAVQADVMRGRATELDKPWTEQRVAINAWTPAAVGNSDRVLRELYKIANEKGHIFGLMQKEGLLSAALNAGQEGLQIGRVGSVSLPVQTVVQKLKLSETDQAFLRRATQLMAEQFFENAKANKSILGPQISNADAQFMQRPMVTEADSAANIKYWVQQHILINKQRGELFKSLNTFDQRMGPRVPAGQYFSSPDYYNIVEKYNELNRQLIERSPFYRQ
jgi:hypothetical protein